MNLRAVFSETYTYILHACSPLHVLITFTQSYKHIYYENQRASLYSCYSFNLNSTLVHNKRLKNMESFIQSEELELNKDFVS